MIRDIRRNIVLPTDPEERREALLSREWLVTNGIGGHASGTIAGLPSRRYHGLLVASLPNPLGRTVMLTELREMARMPDGRTCQLGGEENVGGELHLPGVDILDSFHLEAGLPVWRYCTHDVTIEKRLVMPNLQNTVHVSYSIVEGDGPVRLSLRPAVHFRPQELPVSVPLDGPYVLTAVDDHIEIALAPLRPSLRMRVVGAESGFTIRAARLRERLYRVEANRGYEAEGELWSPGAFEIELEKGVEATVIASTEPWDVSLALEPHEAREAELERRERLLHRAHPRARSGPAAELVIASDAFIVSPAYRASDVARARAAGDDMRTVIAGYHWFTDWGRDTMISLEGLTLTTGRHREAGAILRAFASYTRNGLIPNMFPEGSSDGLYHTADASLWFFHAVDRYVAATDDHETLRAILPTLRSIVEHHLRGTRFGIRIDRDGLMTQGAEGYQLTWMDAKVDDWVVTPRRGKAVELNALWYNALRLLQGWLEQEDDAAAARELDAHARRAFDSFNERFWYAEGGHLLDIVDGEDGDDSACRPNQVFAISLGNPVLEESRWESTLEVVRSELLTPVGLRSLSQRHPEYKPTYQGDLRTRDAAYHQGTVWGWLIGPFIDAWLRVHPERRGEARGMLQGLVNHLDEFGVGSVAEIFDAEPPFLPRGCIAQAWSVSELLRTLMLTEE